MPRNNGQLAYLVSRYPAISHTFILREVLALRKRGFVIHTASINPPDRASADLTEQERAEAATTFFVKDAGAARALGAAVRTALRQPAGLLRGLALAVKLSQLDIRALAYNFFYLAEALLVGDWVRRLHVRHLHVHFATQAATVGLLAARIFGIRLSLTVHGPDEFYDVTAYRLREKVEAASLVCCISDFCRSQLLKIASLDQWDKLHVVRLGVDPQVFAPSESASAGGPFEVVCIGRLVASKGQGVLLRAARLLLDQGHYLVISFVGDGPDRAALETQTRESGLGSIVKFHGAVNQDGIRELYGHAHAFVLPSFAEGIPVVLMEAMAMEIPCVSSGVNGIPELIESGTNGLLTAASNVDDLARAISLLMEQPTLRLRLAKAGRATVVEHYNLETNAGRLADVFERYLAQTAAGRPETGTWP